MRRMKQRGRVTGGRADEREEEDTEMDRQIDEDDEQRDGDGPPPSQIMDRHGDLPVSQSVSHIHSRPHYSARSARTHTMALLCVCLCVCVSTHRAISRYSGPPPPLHV